MEIKILHQIDKIEYRYIVKNADKLTADEVKLICSSMRVKSLLINGKYYSIDTIKKG